MPLSVDKLGKDSLIELAKDYSLSSDGSREVLASRINDHLSATGSTPNLQIGPVSSARAATVSQPLNAPLLHAFDMSEEHRDSRIR